MRRGSRRVIGSGVIAGIAYAGWRAWRARVPAPNADISSDSAPFPFPPVPRRAHAAVLQLIPSIDPDLDGSCPTTYPVKGKLASGIYHLPGSSHYDRTRPDRCYKDPAAAEADGLRAAKR